MHKGVIQGPGFSYLKVLGKTHKGVRGFKPFYIDLPMLSSIAFVTDDQRGHVTLHVVNVQTKKETAVPLEDFDFGFWIGHEPATEFIEVSGEKLLLIELRDVSKHIELPGTPLHYPVSSTKWKKTATVNITAKAIELTEQEFSDADGHVNQRWVTDKAGRTTMEFFDARGHLTERWGYDGKLSPIKEFFDADGHVKERWVDGRKGVKPEWRLDKT